MTRQSYARTTSTNLKRSSPVNVDDDDDKVGEGRQRRPERQSNRQNNDEVNGFQSNEEVVVVEGQKQEEHARRRQATISSFFPRIARGRPHQQQHQQQLQNFRHHTSKKKIKIEKDVLEGSNDIQQHTNMNHQTTPTITTPSKSPSSSTTTTSQSNCPSITTAQPSDNHEQDPSPRRQVISPSPDKSSSFEVLNSASHKYHSAVGTVGTDATTGIDNDDEMKIKNDSKKCHKHHPSDDNPCCPEDSTVSMSGAGTTKTANMSSSTTRTTVSKRPSSSPSYTQLYLDCGQSTFGQVLCDMCGMLYMPGLAEDEKEHRQQCEMVQFGVPCPTSTVAVAGSVINKTYCPIIKGGTVVRRVGDGSTVQKKTFTTFSNQRKTAASFFLSPSTSFTSFSLPSSKEDAGPPTAHTTHSNSTETSSQNISVSETKMLPGTIISWKPTGKPMTRNSISKSGQSLKRSNQQQLELASSASSSAVPHGNTTRLADKGNSAKDASYDLPSQWTSLARLISLDLGMEESNVLRHLSNDIVFLYVQDAGNRTQASVRDGNRQTTKTSTTNQPQPRKVARIVGVVTATIISKAYRMVVLSEKADATGTFSRPGSVSMSTSDRSRKAEKAHLGISLMWTHRSARNKGVATQLIDSTRQNAIFGMTVARSYLAFSSPTQTGFAFADRYIAGGSSSKTGDGHSQQLQNRGILVYEPCEANGNDA